VDLGMMRLEVLRIVRLREKVRVKVILDKRVMDEKKFRL
jgi:hypothetical protein